MKAVGTVARGIRAPLIKSGDDMVQIVVDSVLTAAKEEPFIFKDQNVIAITEEWHARRATTRAAVARVIHTHISCLLYAR